MEEKIYKLLDLIKENGDESPDYEKIKERTPKVLINPKDIDAFLYALSDCEYDVTALEAVLLAVDGDVRCGYKGNGHAKAILFHLYHDGEYEVLIHDRVVRINAPELKSRERYDAFLESDCPDLYMHVGDEDIVPRVLTPDAHGYMMLYLFGTNFGYDMHDYPTMEMDDPTAKSLERAISYLPIFVGYLATKKLPERGMERTFERMEKAGYSSDEIERFYRAWLETIENKNLVCEPLMKIYLFGEYELEFREKKKTFDFADKKDFAKAKAFIPEYVAWLYDVFTSNCVYVKDCYDPDLMLGRLVDKMHKSGYSDEDITDFATLWMQEMLKQNKAFYSSMYLRLFGEHFRGTRVNIDGIKDFDAALALIPDYLNYIFAYEGFDDEYSAKFDPDCELYKLTSKMREQRYGENKINTFVAHWINGVEALQKTCNSPIYVYLFNQFVFKHENFKLDLIENKKSFEQALCYLPKWVEYLTDMSVQYHDGYSERDIFDLLISMHNAGYEKERIETVLSTFLDELERHIPREARHLARELPHYAEKESWLYDFLPVFARYQTEEDDETPKLSIDTPPSAFENTPF